MSEETEMTTVSVTISRDLAERLDAECEVLELELETQGLPANVTRSSCVRMLINNWLRERGEQ